MNKGCSGFDNPELVLGMEYEICFMGFHKNTHIWDVLTDDMKPTDITIFDKDALARKAGNGRTTFVQMNYLYDVFHCIQDVLVKASWNGRIWVCGAVQIPFELVNGWRNLSVAEESVLTLSKGANICLEDSLLSNFSKIRFN